MTDIRPPILLAYDRVILQVQSIYATEHGTNRGAKEWFAVQLGITRQTLDNWGKRAGIPPAYVDATTKITGLKKDDIRPDTVLVELPRKAWSAMCKASPKEAKEATIHNLRRKYG